MAKHGLAAIVAAGAAWSTQAAPWPLRAPHADGVPASFDCGMRKLAYEYGRQLLPSQGSFESLFVALGLNVECDGKLAAAAATQALQVPAAIPASAIFVDAAKGDDAATGTQDQPLRSLHAAVGKVQPGGTLVLRGGSHFVGSTVLLGQQHSGVTIMSYPGETATISGGTRLTVEWKPAKGPRGGNIYVADVSGQVKDVPGLQLDGVRATRARYPNLPGGIEVTPEYGSMIPGDSADWTPPQFDKYGPSKVYTDFKHIRNTSTDGWFDKYTIGIGGLCSVYDPPVSYWCSDRTAGGGAFPFRTPSGMTPKAGVLPNAPYEHAEDAVIFVWRPARWANWMFEVGSYNTTTNNFTFGKGGNQGARGENVGGDFFIENLWEELDNPGEFFFDRRTGQLYLYYNATGAPPAEMEVVAPQVKVILNASSTQWRPIQGLTLQGLRFAASAYTYMDPHGVPSAGDWALERLGAVFLQGTENTTISNCTFERLDGHGVMISGYNRHTTIQDSVFAYIGGSAMASWGYTNETSGDNHPAAGIDGTDGNHPQYNTILRNLVREVGLYEKQNSFYVQAKTTQTRIAGNVFFNGPRAGININDGFGGGDEITQNLVFSTCRESGDHGPFNSWDRQPYLTTVRTGEPSLIMAWREIHHNFFIDNYSPQENVDNDDGSNNFHTHHNFLVYGDNGMKNDFGGHDNYHIGNVYAYVGQALGVCAALDGHEGHFEENKVVFTPGASRSKVGDFACAPPGKTVLRANQYFTGTGDVEECGTLLSDWQQSDPSNDANSTVAKIPSDDTILGWARELLGISAGKAEEALVQAWI